MAWPAASPTSSRPDTAGSAYLGGREPIHTAVERLAGFRAELARHGIAENPRHIRRNLHDDGDAHAAARQLLQEPDPPTALFSAQNLLTMGAIGALHELRLQDAVAHVGFDDLPLAEFLDPGLTVVAQNPRGLGQAAAERLSSPAWTATTAPSSS